jgi:C-terminal processing protease CtpA/Prc
MNRNIWVAGAGIAALAPVLMALPGHSAPAQEKSIQESDRQAVVAGAPRQKVRTIQRLPGKRVESVTIVNEEGPSWLGIETHEVTAGKVKELKLPAERGVIVGRIAPDSPAAKAGLKENDVITEVEGQRVEGAVQFSRMIHEIPSGRTIQLTVWRDAKSQTLSAILGEAEQVHRGWMNTEPGAFAFSMPEVGIPDVQDLDLPEVADLPSMEWDGGNLVMPGIAPSIRPRLGIDAEDISGQLGAYFGAPDGEGILVRNVNPGSAAEKAGVKAGDVITSFNGERLRSLGDLRQKLSASNDDKPAKLGVLRNKSSVTLTVELPPAKSKPAHKVSRSTKI